MDHFSQLLSQLAAEHERVVRECEGFRADAEAWRAVRPDCRGAWIMEDPTVAGDDIVESCLEASALNRWGSASPDTGPTREDSTDSLPRDEEPSSDNAAAAAPDAAGVEHALDLVQKRTSQVSIAGGEVRSGSRKPSVALSKKASIDHRRPSLAFCARHPSLPSLPFSDSADSYRPSRRQRKLSLTFRTEDDDIPVEGRFSDAVGHKMRAMRSRSKPARPNIKLWSVWASEEQDACGMDAIKILADKSKSASAGATSRGPGQTLRAVRTSGCLQKLVMAPSSRPRIAWDLLSTVVLSYDILTVPVVAFVFDEDDVEGSKLVHLGTTAFWTVDIAFSFLSGFDSNGTVEMRPARIASHYVKSWFVLDFPTVALDWCASALLSGHLSEVVGILRVNKVARVIRVLRVVRLLRTLKLPGWADTLIISLRSESMVTSLGILRSLLIISVASHYVACLWYFIGSLEGPLTWLRALEDENRDLPYLYMTALHWSLTQFTPASMEVVPKSTPERVFAICVIISAMVAFSCFVSSITQAMASLQRAHAERDKQRGAMRRFLDENRISLQLGGQISRFATTQSKLARTRVRENDVHIFQLLPESLRQQLHWEVYAPVLSLHPLLRATLDLDDGFVHEVCNEAMSEVSLARYEELFSPGQEASLVYFTRSGTWEFYRHWDDAQRTEVCGERCVCEVALWLQWDIQGVLSALTTCEAACLSASKFHEIVACRPALHSGLRVYASGYKNHVMLDAGGDAVDELGFHPDMLQSIVQEAVNAKNVFSSEGAGSRSPPPDRGAMGHIMHVLSGSASVHLGQL